MTRSLAQSTDTKPPDTPSVKPSVAPGMRALLACLEAIESGLRTARHGCREFRVGVMCQALSTDEMSTISIDAYHESLSPRSAISGLFDWEEAWFAREMPGPPGDRWILVAAAGAGREAHALQSKGYQLCVMEPAADPLQQCREHLAADALIVGASFAELCSAVLEGQSNPATPLVRQYDAILLGWGSLTHVLSSEDRIRLMQCCARLTDGPILASFFMDPHAVARQQQGIMVSMGRGLGKLIRQVRGLAPAEPVEFTDWGGFLRHFTPVELDEIASSIGRVVRWQQEGGFPHVTLIQQSADP